MGLLDIIEWNPLSEWIIPFSQIGLIRFEWKSMRLIRLTELDTTVDDYFPQFFIFDPVSDDAVFWQVSLSSMNSDYFIHRIKTQQF